MPPAEIESAPLPPEGNALSAELWGRTDFILSAFAAFCKHSAEQGVAKNMSPHWVRRALLPQDSREWTFPHNRLRRGKRLALALR